MLVEADGTSDDSTTTSEEEPSGAVATLSLFRIGDVPRKLYDDSPFDSLIYANSRAKFTAEEFHFGGPMTNGKSWVSTGKNGHAKLTKVFKRRDNYGSLMSALRRMKLDV